MTISSLDTALSGLRAAQRHLDVISNNISNAQTDGYTRKILPQEALVLGGKDGIGIGVKIQSIIRHVDKALLRDLVKQAAVSQGHAVTQQYLDRIQAFHGATDAGRSISAQMGKLYDIFAELADTPDSAVVLNKTLQVAKQAAEKFNEFATLLTQMRNQAEDEINSNVKQANISLQKIAELNVRIGALSGNNESTAELEDQRDREVNILSQYIQVSSFTAENNRMVVMTKQGQTLVDNEARQLVFNKNSLGATSYYPGGGADGLYIDSIAGTDIAGDGIGGSLGALLELRDETLPTYTAQLDELAQKTAIRFDQIGLRLFTDENGNVPATVAPPGLVGYVGFSQTIRVNQDILDTPTLLREGTNGNVVQAGSNEVIRKVLEFTFGANTYQEAQGTVDISAGTIFASTGMTQVNRVVGTIDLTDYVPDLYAAPNINGAADTFQLSIGGVPSIITVNPGDTAADLVNTINAAVGSPVASLTGNGQLVIDATGDIDFTNINIGAAGIADLGFSFGTTAAQDPSFTVQVGIQSPFTITVAPGDTAATMLASLNAIPGLTASLGGGGELILTPDEGGDINLANVVGMPIADLGLTVSSIAHTAFRQNNLGPNGSLSTGILGTATLEEFSRNLVTVQAEDAALNKEKMEKETAFLTTLQQRHADQSGVDMDQELSELIRVQTAYTAAARAVSVTERMLDELMQAFR